MAWSAPLTFVAGAILTAGQLNSTLRDNLNATAAAIVTTQGDTVYATAANALARLAKGTAFQGLRMNSAATAPEWSSGTPALDVVTAETTFTNTTTETAFLTYSVPGGTFGTNNLLAVAFWGIFVNNTGSGMTLTWRVKYGATLATATILATVADSMGGATTAGKIQIQAVIKGDGATNSQECMAWGIQSDSVGIDSSLHIGTSAIDSTAASNLYISGQMASASASASMTSKMSTIQTFANV